MDTESLAISRHAPVRRLQLTPHSWVDVVDGFARNAELAFSEILSSTPWAQTEVLRYDAYVPQRRLGAGLRVDSRPLLRQTERHLEATYRHKFSGWLQFCIEMETITKVYTAIESCDGSTTQ